MSICRLFWAKAKTLVSRLFRPTNATRQLYPIFEQMLLMNRGLRLTIEQAHHSFQRLTMKERGFDRSKK